MLEQFIKSILAYFNSIEQMSTYIQSIPIGVEYPCYLVNKVEIQSKPLNSYYFINTISSYIRIFNSDEVDLKNKVYNLTNSVLSNRGKIPVLNEDGSESGRYVRIENFESIPITTDENEIYCVEIYFSFDTTYNIDEQEFELLANIHLSYAAE